MPGFFSRLLWHRTLLGLALLFILGSPAARAQTNLVANPGFEEGDSGWRLFVPPESADKGCAYEVCAVSPHMGSRCMELRSTRTARFALCVKTMQNMPIRAGERARLTFWVRAGADLQTTNKPEFVVRLFLTDDAGTPVSGNEALYIGVNGKTTVQPASIALDLSGLAEQKLGLAWQKVEAVFEIPKELSAARQLNAPEFFAQNTSGSIFLDDVSLERVGANVPLSPSFKKP